MTREEILNGTPEWLNEQTLKQMEIEIVDLETEEGKIRLVNAILTKKRLAYRDIDGELCLTDSGKWNPAEYIQDAMELQKFMDEKGFWLRLDSPFSPESEWFAGFTPHDMTGWNGRPDYQKSGKTASEAITKAFLLACLEVENG
jgi:hypothetical protein